MNNFLWVCWFLGKNLSNFAPPVWKLHNSYCHNIGGGFLVLSSIFGFAAQILHRLQKNPANGPKWNKFYITKNHFSAALCLFTIYIEYVDFLTKIFLILDTPGLGEKAKSQVAKVQAMFKNSVNLYHVLQNIQGMSSYFYKNVKYIMQTFFIHLISYLKETKGRSSGERPFTL